MPMMLDDKVLNELADMLTKWADAASVLTATHGENDPGARAFQRCHGDLYDLAHRCGLKAIL